ncbi:Ig-like domain-containing protein [Ramlibacter alkalitolerans]|uniref:Bacterial Ig-like domain-containing protein n=1 Tax=Ramlibacter alkalitolerans TaxID=2039631 RepID=A0ABS1JQE3_9BURK|nr:Ig-like domain-containing protein [Ramlibacter alkalitolerans]MBL0426489.1 hypothetical protein [Ramlibacter alkalitolerans]
MKAHLRKNAAAAMLLLAPLGAALVAQPAAAQYAPQYRVAQVAPGHVTNVAVPAVESFVADLDRGRLEPGRVLHFRLLGTPRSNVVVNIQNIVSDLPLAETQPGVYVGSYTIRRSDDVKMLDRAVAVLRTGGKHAVARVNMGWREQQASAQHGRDTTPPRILDMTPHNGERVSDRGRNTRLSARLSDDGSGVDPASVRLRINGRDVSRDVRVRDDEVHYREDLPRGRHTVELAVRDRAGNATRTTWTFNVV